MNGILSIFFIQALTEKLFIRNIKISVLSIRDFCCEKLLRSKDDFKRVH